MKIQERAAGLLVVTYADAADLAVGEQKPLLTRLEQRRGGVVIIFEVAEGVRSVPMEVPTFWLGVTARAELRLVGMGIVTHSAAVRVAARGFALANVARRIATQVQTFDTTEDAAAWGATLLVR